MGRGEGGGRREEGKEVWDEVLFCFGGGIEKGRVGRVWEGLWAGGRLIHLVGGGSWVLWVGSGVDADGLLIGNCMKQPRVVELG